jgi:hypothetical protein
VSPSFNELYNLFFYPVKVIPSNISDYFTPISLAYKIYDDGSSTRGTRQSRDRLGFAAYRNRALRIDRQGRRAGLDNGRRSPFRATARLRAPLATVRQPLATHRQRIANASPTHALAMRWTNSILL